MKDINGKIQYKEKEYRIVFNLNVMEAIQERFGSITEWGNVTDGKDEPDIKAVKFAFWAMINEGIDIDNEDEGTNKPHLTEAQVGRMMTSVGLVDATRILNQTVIASTQSEEKNA